jgi:hypothetical protein
MLPTVRQIPLDYSRIGTANDGRWIVFCHDFGATVLLWDTTAGLFINVRDEGSDFPRWTLDPNSDQVVDVETHRGLLVDFDPQFDTAEVA